MVRVTKGSLAQGEGSIFNGAEEALSIRNDCGYKSLVTLPIADLPKNLFISLFLIFFLIKKKHWEGSAYFNFFPVESAEITSNLAESHF